MDIARNFKNTSVSRATHRPEDLIPAFMTFLCEFDVGSYTKAYADLEKGMVSCGLTMSDYNDDPDSAITKWQDNTSDESVQYLIEDLFNWIDDLAPEGYYFGAHPGDGSDFGLTGI